MTYQKIKAMIYSLSAADGRLQITNKDADDNTLRVVTIPIGLVVASYSYDQVQVGTVDAGGYGIPSVGYASVLDASDDPFVSLAAAQAYIEGLLAP